MGRKKRYNCSSVISIRISDEELDDLKVIMSSLQITRVSELMRQAIRLVGVSTSGKAVGSEQLPVCRNVH